MISQIPADLYATARTYRGVVPFVLVTASEFAEALESAETLSAGREGDAAEGSPEIFADRGRDGLFA